MRSVPAFCLLAACAAPPAPPPPPARPIVARLAPPPIVRPSVATSDPAVLPGIWTYERDARGSVAKFGIAGDNARFVIRCDSAGARLSLSVLGSVAAPLRLIASTSNATVDAVPNSAGYVSANVAARTPILDALSFSRGTFSVEAGAASIALPAWPEFARVVEDCRA